MLVAQDMIMRFERKNSGRRRRGAEKQVVAVAGARGERERERGKGDSTTEGRRRAGSQIYGGRRSFKLRQQQLLKQQLVTH